MLSVVQVVVGLLLVGLVFVDAFMTTVAMATNAGPLTRRALALVWSGLLRLHRRDRESGLLTAAGTVLLTFTVFTWVFLLWVGWTLVFSGSGSLTDVRTHDPAGLGDVVYFSGMSLFTLGTGDVVPTTAAWRVVSVVTSFCGLFLVTLAITYLISVVGAVVQRRSLAIEVRGLGDDPQEIVAAGWTGHGFSDVFQQQLVSFTRSVIVSSEQHLAYPVLHYFHSGGRPFSAPLALAALDDALLLLISGVAENVRPDRNAVEPLRSAIERYVDTATTIGPTPEVQAPPPPDRAALARSGVPLAADRDFAAALAATAQRRTALHRLVLADGWSWRPLDRQDNQGNTSR